MFRQSGSLSVRVTRDDTLPALVLLGASSPSGPGRHGTGVAEDTPVWVSLIALLPGVLDEVRLLLVAPFLLARAWFSDLVSLLDGSHSKYPSGGISSRKQGGPGAPPSGVMEAVGIAPEGTKLQATGLPTEVVQTRAPATRKRYALK